MFSPPFEDYYTILSVENQLQINNTNERLQFRLREA